MSCPGPCEIGIDVTDADTGENYQLGDFYWARFDEIGRRVIWPSPRRWLIVARDTLEVAANHESCRPVHSTATTIAIDITGTPLERLHGSMYGRFVKRGRRLVFVPSGDASRMALALQTRKPQRVPVRRKT